MTRSIRWRAAARPAPAFENPTAISIKRGVPRRVGLGLASTGTFARCKFQAQRFGLRKSVSTAA